MGSPHKQPAPLPRELRRLAAVDGDVVRRIDGTVRLRLAATEAPPVTCEGMGCASCCELLTMGALTEGIRIAQSLIARPGVRARFEEDLPAHLAVYQRLGVDRVRYWNERHRCIFLTGGAEPRCKVYEARPIACRTHLSIDPPAACEKRGPEARRRLVDLTEIELAATAHFVETELALGLPILGGPVPVIALWGLALVEHGVAGWRRRFEALPETDPRAPAFWLRRLAEVGSGSGLVRVAEPRARHDGEEEHHRRVRITIDDRPVDVMDTTFLRLLKLVAARFQSEEGWVHKNELGARPDVGWHGMSELHGEVRAVLPEGSRLYENNGSGCYRLGSHVEIGCVDWDGLTRIGGVVARLAEEIRRRLARPRASVLPTDAAELGER